MGNSLSPRTENEETNFPHTAFIHMRLDVVAWSELWMRVFDSHANSTLMLQMSGSVTDVTDVKKTADIVKRLIISVCLMAQCAFLALSLC